MTSFQYPVEIVPAVGIISSLVFWVFIAIVASKPLILVTDVNIYHELLSSTTLQKRAASNQRLVVAFGIENGFTTTREQVLREFRGGVKLSVE
jgi:K+ transporter